jgi:hypothetical protein
VKKTLGSALLSFQVQTDGSRHACMDVAMHDAALLDIGRLPPCGRLTSNPSVLSAWISTPTTPHVGDYTNIYPRRRSSACLHQLRPKRMRTALARLRHLHRPHADHKIYIAKFIIIRLYCLAVTFKSALTLRQHPALTSS